MHIIRYCTVFTMLFVIMSGTVQAESLFDRSRPDYQNDTFQTLISGDIESGGYGAPVVKTTTINGHTGVLVGGQGAWIINHTFALGGGGYGLASTVDVPDIAIQTFTDPQGNSRDLELGMGYGGVLIEYFNNPGRLAHITASALVGAGAVVYAEYTNDYKENSTWDTHDAFFAFEPSVNVELNVTEWMRVAGGVSYLLVRDVDIVGLDDGDIGGVTGNIVFRFGAF